MTEKPPVPYELIDRHGQKHGPFSCAGDAVDYAKAAFPDQEQDPDRTGKGWDIQVVGAE